MESNHELYDRQPCCGVCGRNCADSPVMAGRYIGTGGNRCPKHNGTEHIEIQALCNYMSSHQIKVRPLKMPWYRKAWTWIRLLTS